MKARENDFAFYYLARQPILDGSGRTYGYELLFRSAAEQERAEIEDYDLATMNVAASGFWKNQESIDQSKRIFINFTEPLIASGAPLALPPRVTVIEVQGDVTTSATAVEQIARLQQEGYCIALDNYCGGREGATLLELADIVKVDVLGKSEAQLAAILAGVTNRNVCKLAYRVDSSSAYGAMKALGFELFQGYFFARPENLTGRTIKSFQATRPTLLAAIDDPDLDVDRLVNLVASDPGISYRLLRLLNSAAFGFVSRIESIRHSVTLLGLARIRHWLRMVLLSDLLSTEKPPELLIMALNRGKLLEKLGEYRQIRGYSPESLFLFGMFSLLDVMLDLDFLEILKKLPLPNDFKEGYTRPGGKMARYLKLLRALEEADVTELLQICLALQIKPQRFVEASVQANSWTDSIVSELL